MIVTKLERGMNVISSFKRAENTLSTSWLVAHELNRERSHDENADFSLLAAFASPAKGKAAHSPSATTIGCVRGVLFRFHIGITGPMSIKSDRRIFPFVQSVLPHSSPALKVYYNDIQGLFFKTVFEARFRMKRKVWGALSLRFLRSFFPST